MSVPPVALSLSSCMATTSACVSSGDHQMRPTVRAGPLRSCPVRRAVRSTEASRGRRQSLRPVAAVLSDDKGGTGVLDRPGFDRSGDVSVLTESGFGSSDTVRDKKVGGGNYRVVLVDAPQHSEKLVVKVVPMVVPGVTDDHARNCFRTSRQLGQAIIVTALKEHAEFYSEQLYRQGVRSIIEPDTTTL